MANIKRIYLKAITYENADDLDDTSYGSMSLEERHNMIKESINQVHNNSYFEMLSVYEDNIVIGFMNLYAHSKHIISCGPEIKEPYKKKGYGFQAETKALNYAKEKGYTIAVASVDDTNTASIALHEKLGFEMDRKYTNVQGKTIRAYIKAL